MQCIALQLIGNFSIFSATHCVSCWSQQNHCSVNKPFRCCFLCSNHFDFNSYDVECYPSRVAFGWLFFAARSGWVVHVVLGSNPLSNYTDFIVSLCQWTKEKGQTDQMNYLNVADSERTMMALCEVGTLQKCLSSQTLPWGYLGMIYVPMTRSKRDIQLLSRLNVVRCT